MNSTLGSIVPLAMFQLFWLSMFYVHGHRQYTIFHDKSHIRGLGASAMFTVGLGDGQIELNILKTVS